MRIETNWKDVSIYFVEFKVMTKEGQTMKLRRTLVFDDYIKEEVVKNVISNKFSNVCSIDYIELYDEMGLKLR